MAPNKKINVKERYTDGEIDLSMSDLDDVPVKEIAALKKTTSLDLSNNRLSILPGNFIALTNLTKLDLSKNELKELPEDFGQLSRLKYLDLYKNLLEHLPLSFSKLKELRFLDVKDNPLVPTVAKVAGPCIDTKGCQKCAKDIVVFFTRLQAQVDSEVEMRNKSRRKQLELNQQKRMEEHEKKKIEQSLRRNTENASNQNNSASKKTKKEKKNKRNKYYKDDSSEYTLFNVFVTILFASFLITMALFLLTSVKLKYTNSVELLVRDSYQSFVLKLPPNMQPYAHKTGELIQGIHESVGRTTNLIIQYLNLEKHFETVGNLSCRAYAYVAKKMVDLIAEDVVINNNEDVI